MRFVIEGDPVATMRPKCVCLKGHGHVYDHKTQKENMKRVRAQILKLWNEQFDSPENNPEANDCNAYFVTIQFYMPIPKSILNSQRNLMLWAVNQCIDKPDYDNLAKLYTDCGTGIIWKDDKNITVGIAHKVRFSNNPRVVMDIRINADVELSDQEKMVFKTFSPEELKELCLLAIKLSDNYGAFRAYFEDGDQLPYKSFFSETALHVANIAKYADKLKKVAKLC